jgi:2-polyprenyl-3-methyl-5-hydroxy-6-metoxy-1,4-benzoquinol methylase
MLTKEWKIYWNSFVPFKVDRNYFELNKLLNLFPDGRKEFIEIGGFPGIFSIYFSKFKNYNVTLLDKYMEKDLVNKMLIANGLDKNTIKIIRTGFESYNSKKKYDVVFSAGFIEHFNNIENIIDKHYLLLKNGGTLFISVPNLKGINGLVQRIFDKRNYYSHNLKAMDPKELRRIFEKYNLKNIKIFYYCKPCLWLEKDAGVPPGIRQLISILSEYLSHKNKKNWLLSPHLAIYGVK